MSYTIPATAKTPALIIYLLDVSASMTEPLGNKQRIQVVTESLVTVIKKMIFRSTKGTPISPRYRIAMYAYSDEVYDLLDGVKTIAQVASFGVPQLNAQNVTDTAKAFGYAEKLLQSELPKLNGCPAPLICHMTDGKYTGSDPTPIVQRIMQMKNPDGNVLVENIYLEDISTQDIKDPYNWSGILPSSKLKNKYAETLRKISSPIPDSYRQMMQESGYNLSPEAVMMFPGTSPELVGLGFAMSAATPIR